MKRIATIVVTSSLAAGALLGAGVSWFVQSSSILDAAPSGRALASYAGRKLALSEAESQFLLPNPPSSSLLSTKEGRKEFVEGLVRVDLLAHLAEEKGYLRDPVFLNRLKQELAARYLEKEYEEPARLKEPTDADVAKYQAPARG